jgi:DNA-binding NarL/FixJ family response regulator
MQDSDDEAPVPGGAHEAREGGEESSIERLTEREIAVLALVARGVTNRKVAESVGVSEATVKSDLQHIFRKLGVSDRTEAAVIAVRRGLI